MFRKTTAVIAILFAVCSAASVNAALVHVQSVSDVDANGNAYVAWEAEMYSSTTVRTASANQWSVFTDASGSGNQALLADDGNLAAGDSTNSPSGATSNLVTYDLQFIKAGTYTLYWRGRAGSAADGIGGTVGGNDGWFAPAGGFDDNAPALRVNGYGKTDLVRLGGSSTTDNYTTTYQWFRQGGTLGNRIEFIVTADNVANGDILTISMATREDGLLIDRWILSENNYLFGSTAGNTSGELDAFSNATVVVPTPAALPAGLALLGAMTLRRRGA